MNNSAELIGLAESLVQYAQKNGADETEVHISQGREFGVDVRNGEIEKLVEAGYKDLSIRIIKDKKTANVNSSDFNADTLKQLIHHAIERAEVCSPDPFSGLPETDPEARLVNWRELEIFDAEIEELPAEKKIELAKQTEAIALADERITNSYGSSFGSVSGKLILVNSNGFSGSYKKTSCSLGVYLQAGDGDNKVEAGWYETARYFKKMWTPEQIAKEAVHRVTRLINPRKVKTQNVPVVLEPSVTQSILSFLYRCIHGRSIYMNQSFLVDKIGERIADSGITIVDNGLLPGGIGTRPFDSEGVPLRKNVVIKNGVLKTYLTDTYSARKLKTKSTGNASGANNFYLEKGERSPEEIIRSVKNGLLLTGTMGQGTNTVTGDFSKGAFGLWIEDGEIAYPVAEITVSGNLGQMLKNIELVGNDLRFTRSITGPTIKIGEMTISGV